jgi:uncharacterized NAD(P)/FAD-binding protein YdhS
MLLDPGRRIVIIGSGFSGTLLAINLARFGGPHTTLIERRPEQMARGVAYSTPHPSQLLNVRAGGMSAYPDDPGHFTRWLTERGGGSGQTFVPRALYGAYLREMLVEAQLRAGGKLAVQDGEACDIETSGARRLVHLADGTTVPADAVVLAVGNLPPHTPPGVDEAALSPDVYIRDPWFDDPVADLKSGDRVVLLGTGLTAVDVALTLDAAGFEGEILAISRRGLAPRRHMNGLPPPDGLDNPPLIPLSQVVRDTRNRASKENWREVVDSFRPVTQRMWGAAGAPERLRFLRHLRPFWDVHRHRLAPPVADRIEAMIASGKLRLAAGKMQSTKPSEHGVTLTWRPRHGDALVTTEARRLINCTGPQGDLLRSDEPLLRILLDRGAIRPDALRLGLDVDGQSRVIDREGTPHDDLYCVGPMTRGGLWEVVAVPDLRRQSWDLARKLANAQWVGGEGL